VPLGIAHIDAAIIRAVAYFAATLIVAWVVDRLMRRHSQTLRKVFRRELTASEATRIRMVRRLTVAAILFVGIALALIQLPQVGTLARGMIASAGITALIIGFASRSVIANLVAGVIIAFSQPVRIGDYVVVDDLYGSVEEIGLTYTYIRTLDNRRVVIPNEQLASKVIQNYTIVDPISAAAVDFAVPVSASLASVKRVAEEEAGRAAGSAAVRGPRLDVTDIGLDAIRLRVQVWLDDPLQAREVADGLRLALAERLRREGILGGAVSDAGS
jgi:small conductance mechanosensitive channel